MSVQLSFNGGVYIADKSAWESVRRAPAAIQNAWRQAVIGDQIRTCSIVNLELLYSAQTTADVYRIDEELAALRRVPITDGVCRAAEAAYRALGRTADRAQRTIPFPDFLIAAAAEDTAIGVLHYDRHFDFLRNFLEFESCWVAPRGTL